MIYFEQGLLLGASRAPIGAGCPGEASRSRGPASALLWGFQGGAAARLTPRLALPRVLCHGSAFPCPPLFPLPGLPLEAFPPGR